MPATATLVGSALGLGVQLYSNAVRKLPLLRSALPWLQCCALATHPNADPWEHVIAVGLGGVAGSAIVAWEARPPQ